MKTKYKYIEFIKDGEEEWACMNRKEQYQMAYVYYSSKRRNWVIEFDVGFEWWGNCLLDVNNFLNQLNKVKEK